MISITATDIAGNGHTIRIDRNPDECPWCHRHVHPKYVAAYISPRLGQLQSVYRCTSNECEKTFVATYTFVQGGVCPLRRTDPWKPKNVAIPPSVAEISPQFVAVRKQVEAADSAGLDQLVGIGLRKALEFLIKDFAVSQNPASTESILAQPLAACINNYVSDENVKQCAARAAWLGNDETHYVRKWESKDVDDLRVLVQLTTNWIENVLLTQKYMAEMKKT